jgi:hypothetical protein
MKEHTPKEGSRTHSATGPAGPIPHPFYCTPQCYAKGKRELAKSCECRGCRGDAHGRGRKYAFDHGYLKLSPPGSRKLPTDQAQLFSDEISPEQEVPISISNREIRWISAPLPEGLGPDKTVWISVAKLDASWKKNRSQYIGRGGSGKSIGDRYIEFGLWLKEGKAAEIPWVGLDDGEVAFTNGGHRFASLRDHGLKSMPVDVDPAIADEMRQRFGTKSHSSALSKSELIV